MNKAELKSALESKKVKELYVVAKSVGIKDTHKYRKSELIVLILNAYSFEDDVEIKEIDTPNNEAYEQEVVKEIASAVDEAGKVDRSKYLKGAEVGTIVAFRTTNGKVKSAAIVEKDEIKKRLILETAYKKRFNVPYDSVIWVKTGSRFPSGVYKLLKG